MAKGTDKKRTVERAAHSTRVTKKTVETTHVVRRWLKEDVSEYERHSLILMSEVEGKRESIVDGLRETVRSHYVSPEVTARRLESLGAPKTAQLLREDLPTEKKARSGDLGEILATEIAEQFLHYTVPIRRLRWKDGRNMALRGDDIIGVNYKQNKKLVFLKGESKSRVSLSTAVLDEAGAALDSDRGRPMRHSVLFVAKRLRGQGEDDLAEAMEEAVLNGFKGMRVEHLLFALTGSNPRNLMTEHLKAVVKKRRRRYAVGVHIEDHEEFIEALFKEL